MESLLAKVAGRLRNRPDSEHEQAVVRFFIGALAAYYLVRTAFADGVLTPREHVILWLVAVFFAGATAIFALIVARPGVSVGRRYAGMVLDISATTAALAVNGELAAPLFPVYLWVIFGNGFRYGLRALGFSALLSASGFLLAALLWGFGRTGPHVVAGLLVGLVVLPTYVAFLLAKLTGAIERAQAADEAKARFLDSVSRELRTPLHGILGTTEVLLDGRLSAEQRRSVLLVHRSASWLLEVLEAVLELSQLRAGHTSLEEADFDLPEVLEGAVELYRAVAGPEGPRLETRVDPGVPRTVLGDRVKLLHVLQQLLRNAVEHTPEGRVTVTARAAGSKGDRTVVAITVADTGVGIPPEARAGLFEAFAESGGRRGRAGLGLALSRDLVRALGGEIGIESDPGRGTSVTFTVPLAPGDPERTVAAAAPPPTPLPRPPAWRSRPRVLVAEGNGISREVLGTLLRHFGCETVFAESGAEALADVSRERFDLLIIDCQLHGTDGCETAREVRRRLPAEALPILGIGGASSGFEERCRGAGIEDFLEQPFRAADLLDALTHRLATHIAPEGSAAGAAPRPDDLVGSGMPSGGIAPRAAVHEINNALTGLLGYADLLAMGLGEDQRLKGYADRIVEAGERARQILLAMPRG